MSLYIGLMSGTSMDGIDAALVEITATPAAPRLLSFLEIPYSQQLRADLGDAVRHAAELSLADCAILDHRLGEEFSRAVVRLLEHNHIEPRAVAAIGSHGQTLWHHPDPPHHCSIQLGNAAVITSRTGIPTVTDFRSMDIATGGQGAPLAPLFHQALFRHPAEPRLIVNIGGIANLSVVPPGRKLTTIATGFDTGPGNTLMDTWVNLHWQRPFDQDGELAANGKIHPQLLQAMLNDAYFRELPPKSTGLEYFNLEWLQHHLGKCTQPKPIDVLATLAELSACSIAEAITNYTDTGCDRLYLCGGGAHNSHLVQRLRAWCAMDVLTTDSLGVAPGTVEATGFAWLAHCRLTGERLMMTPPADSNKPDNGHIPGGCYLP